MALASSAQKVNVKSGQRDDIDGNVSLLAVGEDEFVIGVEHRQRHLGGLEQVHQLGVQIVEQPRGARLLELAAAGRGMIGSSSSSITTSRGPRFRTPNRVDAGPESMSTGQGVGGCKWGLWSLRRWVEKKKYFFLGGGEKRTGRERHDRPPPVHEEEVVGPRGPSSIQDDREDDQHQLVDRVPRRTLDEARRQQLEGQVRP